MLERLAELVIHHRKPVVGAWILLTLFGVFAAKQVSTGWLEQFSIPGYSAYETNQTTLHVFGNGENAPHVVVITSPTDVTKVPEIRTALPLVPSIMRLAGEWNWWFPRPIRRVLFLPTPQPEKT